MKGKCCLFQYPIFFVKEDRQRIFVYNIDLTADLLIVFCMSGLQQPLCRCCYFNKINQQFASSYRFFKLCLSFFRHSKEIYVKSWIKTLQGRNIKRKSYPFWFLSFVIRHFLLLLRKIEFSFFLYLRPDLLVLSMSCFKQPLCRWCCLNKILGNLIVSVL